MKKKFQSLYFIVISAFSSQLYALGSPLVPLKGTYVVNRPELCVMAVATGTQITIHREYIGQRTMTPELTQGYNAWVSSASFSHSTTPPLLSGITKDPTSTSVTYLTETPIQWGNFIDNEDVAQYLVPAVSAPTNYRHVVTNHFFVTSFNYAIPSNNNGVTKGYALYTFNPTITGTKIWYRKPFYANNITTEATNFQTMREIQEKNSYPNANTTFNCIASLNARK